jgi:hypothetical protein
LLVFSPRANTIGAEFMIHRLLKFGFIEGIMTSLWKVNASSIQVLMKEFYNQLKTDKDKASAQPQALKTIDGKG